MSLATEAWGFVASRVLPGLAGLACVTAVSAVPASATTDLNLQQTWGTNGRVLAILADPVSDRVYVAGNFTEVTDQDGTKPLAIANVAAFDPDSGEFDASWRPNPNGVVRSLALSGGRVYLGGDFTRVGSDRRTHLAAVDSGTGDLASWAPRATGGVVSALAVKSGQLYVGGNFTALAGVARPYLGRVSMSTGELGTLWTPRLDARVRTLAVSGDGSRMYVGGDFTRVNENTAGQYIASINTSRPGTLTAGFNAGATNAGKEAPAIDLHLDGDDLLAAVAGGGGGCTSLDASTGRTDWSHRGNGNMQAVTTIKGTVYCGGHFGGAGSFAGFDRYKIAAVDQETGKVLDFGPRVNSPLGIWALENDATRLYLGGDFTKISGKPHPHFAVYA
ncbi:MAG TPA: PQQ-binding-like beta-propeller repeat protein [Nocardioidaceae bacterium]|nr:PQQ-binding-like beta-propeller repeat protein [Nocardioidaceae bacterium]